MWFYSVVGAASIVSLWIKGRIDAAGNKFLGPVVTPISAPAPVGTTSVNVSFVLAVVGLLFGAGYLLRGVSSLVR